MSIKNTYKEKLKDLIEGSKIIPQQKKLWNIFLAYSDETENEAIYEAASTAEENLLLLSNNLHDKVMAMVTGSEDLWNKVISEEQLYLDMFD